MKKKQRKKKDLKEQKIQARGKGKRGKIMATLEELYEIIKNDRKYSHWSAAATPEQRIEELLKEIKELKEGWDKKDSENIREEMGDVLWDVLALMVIIEETEKISSQEIIIAIIEKMKQRKPYIFEERKPSREEESILWKTAKQAQKTSKQNQ